MRITSRLALTFTFMLSVAAAAAALAEDTPAEVAKRILDKARPEAEREAAVRSHPGMAAQLVQEMTRDLKPGTPAEYERTPWVWRVAVACGRRNDAGQLKRLMDVSLPGRDQTLHDWQAVVLGGGVAMGVSDAGQWPARRVAELLAEDKGLAERWNHAMDRAVAMADAEKVPPPTRYDALRLLAAEQRGEPWVRHGRQIRRYLAKGTQEEVQSGAVAAAADIDSPQVAAALLDSLLNLAEANRKAALDALLKTEARAAALLDAVEAGKVHAKSLGAERAEKLRKHTSQAISRRAAELLKAQ